MTVVRVPGKVLVAGEYAVLLPKSPCLVLAVDRYLEAKSQPASEWSVRSGDVVWEDGHPVPEALSFVVEAVNEVRRRWPGVTPKAIETRDGLRDGAGRKLGLGGSAASTVASAFAASIGTQATREQLWSLCDEVHRRVQGGRGSGADVASAVHGGVVRYVRQPLRVTPVAVHPDVRFLLAWTGNSAKTTPKVARFEAFVDAHPREAQVFADASSGAVDLVEAGLRSGDMNVLRNGFSAARSGLRALESLVGFELETPQLARAADIAWAEGAAGKLSGAGGGDCAVIVTLGDEGAYRVANALSHAGIEPVRVGISGGVDVVER